MQDPNFPYSFAEILQSAFTNIQSGAQLTVAEIVGALVVSVACSGWIAYLYKFCYQGVLYQKSFALTLMLAGLITTSIIMVISGNLILSLGMVGALSIVRFRSAIKDPLDIIFLFWTISVGIANGVGYFKVSLTSLLMISIIFLIATRFYSPSAQRILVVRGDKLDRAEVDRVIAIFSRINRVRSHNISPDGCELITEVKAKNESDLVDALQKLTSVNQVTSLSYSGTAID